MATSRKIGFFLRKKPRSPTGERARNVLRTTPSVRPEIARKAARHPALAAGGAVSRVCAYARAVARVCAQGARRCLCRGVRMRAMARVGRVGVWCVSACRGVCAQGAHWARGGARSRRRSRRFCRKSVDPSVFPPYLQEGVRINMRGIRQAPCKTLFCK